MRTLCLAFLLLFSNSVFANMANPVHEGTLGASPFASLYIDILHENLRITLHKDPKQVAYEVEYRILVERDSLQVPFLFVAMEYAEGFQVELNGKVVEALAMPQVFREVDTFLVADFDALFGGEVSLANGEHWPMRVAWEEMQYFKADLRTGEHVVRVRYTGIPWEDNWGWTKKYSFRYALSPAQYWKSFGGLSLVVDARDWSSSSLVSNLPPPDSGSLAEVAQWEFEGLPVEVILLEDQAEVPAFAQLLIDLGPFRLAWVFAGLLALVHGWWLWRHRKKNQRFGLSWRVALGGILVPALTLLFLVGLFALIESLSGNEATGTKSYGLAMGIMLLPFVIPMYAAAMFVVDVVFVFIHRDKEG